MGKRQVVVISSSSSSSSEEGRSLSKRRGLRSSKSKTRKSAPERKLRNAKKARFSTLHKGSSGIEEVDLDVLSEELRGFNVVPDRQWDGSTELWVDKYKPSSVVELAVHGKKTEQVKMWLEQRIGLRKNEFQDSTLLIVGPSGVGKSTTIHVLAGMLGSEVCEWNTPTPTLWQEHLHNSNLGISYNSKLDEFVSFVESMRKYPSLPSLSKENLRKSFILLIDDLPVANTGVAYKRLSKCLQLLVQLSQVPTVVLFTELRRCESIYSNARNQEDLISDLERAGACKVSFNPVTANNIKKVLSNICKAELLEVSSEFLDGIAKASHGDIRHAITTLQYLCLKPDNMTSSPPYTQTMTYQMQQENKDADLVHSFDIAKNSDARFLQPFGKDETLSLFHALGKFLHNKREASQASDLGKSSFTLQERYLRSPLKMDAPEKVLLQAHAQPGSLIDFLYENVLDFISDEAVDDACTVSFYLSECDQLRATASYGSIRSQLRTEMNESDSIPQQVAALVAVRGVLYGNSHPSPSRWHSFRTPKLWQTEFLYLRNKNQIVADKLEPDNSFSMTSLAVMATEFRPALKWLQYRSAGVGSHEGQCQMELEAADSVVDNQLSDAVESDTDEIEDW